MTGVRDPVPAEPGGGSRAAVLAVCSAVWWVWLALVPPGAQLLGWEQIGEALAGPHGPARAGLYVAFQAAWVGLCAFAALVPAGARGRAGRVVAGVLGGLVILAFWTAAARIGGVASGLGSPGIGLALGGIAVGAVLWLALGSALGAAGARIASHARAAPGLGSVTLVVLLGVLLVEPLRPDSLLGDLALQWPTGSASDVTGALGQHLYVSYKGILLWVPIGLVGAFAGGERAVRRWLAGGLGGFVLVGGWQAGAMPVGELAEIAYAPLGIALGLWIGNRARVGAERASDARMARPPELGRSGGRGSPMPERTARVDRNIGAHPYTRAPTAAVGLAPATARAGVPRGASAAGRGAAAVLLVVAAAIVWDYPRWPIPLAVGLAIYAALLWRYPRGWLVAVPAALPLLDLAPWTGLRFVDELDAVLALSVAIGLVRLPVSPARRLDPLLTAALGLLALSVILAAVRGLLPLHPLDENAFTSYWSHYNALRVAKGFGWGFLLLALLRRSEQPDGWSGRLFALGMCLGLAGVVLVGIRERWLFADLTDLSVPYRVVSTFSSMHTGGGHIETYLVTAIPFLCLVLLAFRSSVGRAAAAILLLASVYLVAITISRGGAAALVLVLGVVGLAAARARAVSGWAPIALAAALAAGVVGVLAVGVAGDYFQRRLASVEEDSRTRLRHWRTALELADDSVAGRLFGTGLGRFPRRFVEADPYGALPGTYGIGKETGEETGEGTGSDNRFLRLGGGETLYLAQRVAVAAGHRYRLTFRARSAHAQARLDVPLCERHLLDSKRCRWQGVRVAQGAGWQPHTVEIDSGEVGGGSWLARRPTELTLFNPVGGTVVEIDDVHLADRAGTELVVNGGFSDGLERWFFKTHTHLPYHVKNLWAAAFFEQGILGLAAFLLLLVAVLFGPAVRAWRGDLVAGVSVAAVVGYFAVGLVDSPFDAPRLTALLFLVCASAWCFEPRPASPPPRPNRDAAELPLHRREGLG